jgi:hypothetical protein
MEMVLIMLLTVIHSAGTATYKPTDQTDPGVVRIIQVRGWGDD